MSVTQHALTHSSNNVIRSLGNLDQQLLAQSLDATDMPLRKAIEVPGQAIPYVYFMESGFASIVAAVGDRKLEACLVGPEGFTGGGLISGDLQSPFECYVQMGGTALRLSTAQLFDALASSNTLRSHLLTFTRASSIQTSFTALANRHWRIDSRLARWLLMVHDRILRDEFAITHEFLALMLGVRRPGVTEALQFLEGQGLIKSLRGIVQIRNRTKLIDATDGAYGPAEREYRRITGMKSSARHDARDLVH